MNAYSTTYDRDTRTTVWHAPRGRRLVTVKPTKDGHWLVIPGSTYLPRTTHLTEDAAMTEAWRLFDEAAS